MNIALGMLSESGNVIDRLQALGDAQEQLHDPDYWSTVGIISLTGILVVFLILAILIFFFWLMGTIFKAVDKSKQEKKAAAQPAVKPETPAVQEAEEAVSAQEVTDSEEEIVAVISAAVAAYAAAEGTSYSIRSIKKHADKRVRSAWNMAGISGNMQKF